MICADSFINEITSENLLLFHYGKSLGVLVEMNKITNNIKELSYSLLAEGRSRYTLRQILVVA